MDSSGAISEVKQFTKEVDKMGKKGKKSADKLRKSFERLKTRTLPRLKSLTIATAKWGVILGGLAGAAIIGKVIKASADLERSMLNVRKTTGLSAETIDILRREFIAMSRAMPIAADELAEIGAVAGQLGIQGRKNILAFTDVVAKIAITTDLTAQEAARSMAQIANVMKVPISETVRLGSVMNELSNTTVATARDIADLTLRMGGAGKQLGLTAAQIMGISATIRDMGVSTEVGGTAMSQVFTNVMTKTNKFTEAAG